MAVAGAVARPRYEPMAHPGNQRRWDRDAILVALQEWVGESRSAPRRMDWCGEQAQHAGWAQCKWMREHPRWPSSSCVTTHFGTWSAALEAAGLPARRLTFETSVSDRVQAARRLSVAGLVVREIAFELDVSISSVHNYLRAADCPDCGRPVTNPRARRRAGCAGGEPTISRTWTREGVQSALREWRSERGKAPTYRDWTPSRTRPGCWEAQSPRWPSAAVVCDLYGEHPDPWNAALLDAGVGVRLRRWSDAAVRAALARFWIETGRAPRNADLSGSDWHGPHLATVRRRYGSLTMAWGLLGPVPPQQQPGGSRLA